MKPGGAPLASKAPAAAPQIACTGHASASKATKQWRRLRIGPVSFRADDERQRARICPRCCVRKGRGAQDDDEARGGRRTAVAGLVGGRADLAGKRYVGSDRSSGVRPAELLQATSNGSGCTPDVRAKEPPGPIPVAVIL